MMGYTHTIVGAGGALAAATLLSGTTPESYLVASVAGAIGGVAVDIDVKDRFSNPKVTDAGRSRLAVIIMLVISIGLDYYCGLGIFQSIISRNYLALGGVIVFLCLLVIGHFTRHRTFSHSLLFVAMTTICVYCICPKAAIFYLIGTGLHLLLDLFNYPFDNHGVMLFYPIKGRGIALGVCKAAGSGNKVLYFMGLVLFAALTAFATWKMSGTYNVIPVITIGVFMVIAMHFVRRRSEKEQRQIMHMNGEL